MDRPETPLLELLPEKQRSRWRTKGIKYVRDGIKSFDDLELRQQKMVITYLLRSDDLRGLLYRNHKDMRWEELFSVSTEGLILDLRKMLLEEAHNFIESILKIGQDELRKLH